VEVKEILRFLSSLFKKEFQELGDTSLDQPVPDKEVVTFEELVIFTLATTDALIEHLIEKGMINESELMGKLSAERVRYQLLLQRIMRRTSA
jgi:hypothetical protein